MKRCEQENMPYVIIQHAITREVLLFGYMDKYAYYQTLHTNKLHLFDRKKHAAIIVGDCCGHHLIPKEYLYNDKHPCIIIKVETEGSSCSYCRTNFLKAVLHT